MTDAPLNVLLPCTQFRPRDLRRGATLSRPSLSGKRDAIGKIQNMRRVKDGLVAAAGVHFWTDVVFHVMWGLF